ncbi:b-block binding subunit of TFIIIC domain-containing protein [Sarocladium implicatum]|nr:b-block binding subunit of TFIIIC domain-containing protein [Sarocladium implicatum]
MARDLEGLVAELVVFVACGGDRGCSIFDILEAADERLVKESSTPKESVAANRSDNGNHSLNTRQHAAVWRWLTQRCELSVGDDREFNHLTLDQVLSLSQGSAQDGEGPSEGKQDVSNSAPRVYATNEAQWDFIAGHPQDFTRVLQLEWRLLQGVASSRSEGILQADLCRLVDQDKRSVPKRTDSLVKKGYLTKRTTLVRGTKTSRMWLRSLAPTLARGDDAPSSTDLGRHPLQHTLTNDLEPVPWRSQWTGQSLDYVALTSTTVAIIKQWGVIRMHDLKQKLGIIGIRWQMKVLAKLCRAMNKLGAIRYTAATLDGKLFKDCIQFARDLVPQDLTVLFAAGKHREQPVEPSYDFDQQEHDEDGGVAIQGVNAALLVPFPPWTTDKPLALTISDSVAYFGSSGATNPELISLSLGPSFSRFIATLTASLSASDVQPDHLSHLRLTSEQKREGKVASYRFFMQSFENTNVIQSAPASAKTNDTPYHNVAARGAYGFSSIKNLGNDSISKIVGIDRLRSRSGKKLKKLTKEPLEETPVTQIMEPGYFRASEKALGRDQASSPSSARQRHSDRAKEILARDLGQSEDTAESTQFESRRAEKLSSPEQSESNKFQQATQKPQDNVEETGTNVAAVSDRPQPPIHESNEAARSVTFQADNGIDARAEGARPLTGDKISGQRSARGGSRGRGRGKRGNAVAPRAGVKPWVCEKCGGSWKNDLGLKYHQQKARTSCNPNFDPAQEMARRGRKPKYALFLPEDGKQVSDTTAEGKDGKRQLRQRRKTHTPFEGGDDHDDPLSSSQHRDVSFSRQDHDDVERRVRTSVRRPEKGLRTSSRTQVHVERTLTTKADGALVSRQQIATRQVPVNATDDRALEMQQDPPYSLPVLPLGAQGSRSSDVDDVRDLAPESIAQTATPIPALDAGKTKGLAIHDTDEVHPQKLSRSDLVRQVTAILEGCFTADEIVLPGRDVIIRIIQSRWSHDYPDQRDISNKECESALRQLVKRNKVAEHWHAFRNKFGSFSKCQILTRPEVDPLSPVCLEMVDKVIAAHPKPYFPEGFEDASPTYGQIGRRALPVEVAVLDAPVYAAQVAVKRALEAENDKPPRPRKRRRWDSQAVANSPDSEASPDWEANEGDIESTPNHYQRRGAYNGNAHAERESSPGLDFDDVQFLQPNTYLDEDEPALHEQEPKSAMEVSYQEQAPESGPGEYALVEPALAIQGSNGRWPELELQDFEDDSFSFTMKGWIPDPAWHLWESRARQLARPPKAVLRKREMTGEASYRRFRRHLKKVKSLEVSRAEDFVQSQHNAAGPNNLFVPIEGPAPQGTQPHHALEWIEESAADQMAIAAASSESSEGEGQLHVDPKLKAVYTGVAKSRLASYANLLGVKRVLLTSRSLTAIGQDANGAALVHRPSEYDDAGVERGDDEDELLAAFIAVRALLGGVDKNIDWGLLTTLFPSISLDELQRFWEWNSIEHERYIAGYTQEFHEKFIEAYARDELPAIDYDDPFAYDWDSLIAWTMDIAHESAYDIPSSVSHFKRKFEMEDARDKGPDWRNDFFHPQSSLFSRFEWIVSEPGAVSLTNSELGLSEVAPITDLTIVRSWVRSLCCAAEGRFSTQEIKDKFLSVPIQDAGTATALLATAIEQLTEERVIRRNPKPPLGGRPYQLSESFHANLEKFSQIDKYLQAATFKTKLDAAFRQMGMFRISYALEDGAIMAITSLSAAQRIVLRPRELPDIPYGFEPGNYESRKYPKRYYHFELEVVPTETYLYDDNIDVLQVAVKQGPALGSSRGELPQWVNFEGEVDRQRWSSVLAAFCFTLATRGPMAIEALCAALDPVLAPYEAMSLISWGKGIGVLTNLTSKIGITVGEWWWLVVPRFLDLV